MTSRRRRKRRRKTAPPAWLRTFSRNLLKARARLRVSQKELARRTGLYYQGISAIENERRFGLSYETAHKIAEGLGVSLDELMGVKKPKPRPGNATKMPNETRVE